LRFEGASMSEFTDYMQILTRAETLADLRAQLVETVGSGNLPLYELPVDSLDSTERAETAWHALPKPVWVMVLTGGSLDDLAKTGPAFHLMVEEDLESWAIALRCAGQSWNFAVLQGPDAYREATLRYDAAIWDAVAVRDDAAAMAACLSVAPQDLTATFIPDGGQAFSALIGASYEQMEDQGLSDYTLGEVSWAVSDWAEMPE
jgi:hypothetical protein